MRREVVFAIPGDLEAATGGYAYDRRMVRELRALGWGVEILPLGPGFPEPAARELQAAADAFAGLAEGTLVLVDGLAFGVLDDLAEAEGERLRLVALVHHPLADETGVAPERAAQLQESETRALARACRVVATSRTTAETLRSRFGVDPTRLAVAAPGTEPAPRSTGKGMPPVLLALGSLIPRKGQDTLLEALAGLTDLDWHCRIVGSTERHPAFAARVAALVDQAGLGDRVTLVGEVSDARAEMAAADLFVLPTRHEGYGMVFGEAMSQGLPVVGCAVGAVPEVVTGEGGVLVPPDDPGALADALRPLIADRAMRRRWAEAALRAAGDLPDWSQSATRLARALEEAGA